MVRSADKIFLKWKFLVAESRSGPQAHQGVVAQSKLSGVTFRMDLSPNGIKPKQRTSLEGKQRGSYVGMGLA